MTVALFVVFAGVFSLPYAVRVIMDGCRDTLEFGGLDIVRFGPMLHYSAGAVLVTFLALVRRAETGGGVRFPDRQIDVRYVEEARSVAATDVAWSRSAMS
ncbi:hypothetical protein ABT158_21475 [Nonomuraea sp. NPDC001636]|uniref:hypothetical protein n=1 Tax=Nonomuraea sp. NPDC001636 TaxID=3154391 RepID=UPI00332C4B32